MLNELLEMLTYGRPSGREMEQKFISKWIEPLGAKQDLAGNLWLVLGDSPILWSSHTDTVHLEDSICPIIYGDSIVSSAGFSCLGADCTVGVWIMVNLARKKIPGTYIWHRGEEIGGIGSSYIAKHKKEWLKDIKYAIAFDRKGTEEIITHQTGERCCSKAFGKSLQKVLSPLKYNLSSSGVFTDTANYTEIISECTNLSVGYKNCHTPKEILFIPHALNLLKRALTADWNQLVYERDPKADSFFSKRFYSHQFSPVKDDSLDKLVSLCRHYPYEVSQVIQDYGITAEDIENQVWATEEWEH